MQSTTPGLGKVTDQLDARGVPYDVIEHSETYTAEGEAAAVRADPAATGKTLVLRDRDRQLLVVVPADRHLDLARVRELTGATHHLRLATEEEIAHDFPLYEVGAMPPVGPGLPAVEIVDLRLLDHERAIVAGGDHRHALLIPIRELLRVVEPRVADVCRSRDPDGKDFYR